MGHGLRNDQFRTAWSASLRPVKLQRQSRKQTEQTGTHYSCPLKPAIGKGAVLPFLPEKPRTNWSCMLFFPCA